MTPAQREQLLPALDDLCAAVEDVVRTGLTAASAATRERLTHLADEATRRGLGRLAASLRFANDEIGRYLASSPAFNAQRLALFLNRAWIVAKGLRRAITRGDERMLAHLLGAPASAPVVVPKLDAVVLGVEKRMTAASGSFQFRMRGIGSDHDGRSLVWSFVFARKAPDVPGEAWLHLPQPQRFEPKLLLGGGIVAFTGVAVGADGRIQLSPKATVTVSAAGARGERDLAPLLPGWDPARLAARLRAHAPSPLDLEVELAEEVVLREWTVGEPVDRGDGLRTFPITAHGLPMRAAVRADADGRPLVDALTELRRRKGVLPPLFGLVHAELCALHLQPLSVAEDGAMRHLSVSAASIDKKSLLALLDL